MITLNEIGEFLSIVLVAVLLDNVGYWKMGNWSRQFSGESPNFTYLSSMFPRFIFTIAGCFTFFLALQDPDNGGILFVSSVLLIGGSNAYLYYKAVKGRDKSSSERR